MINLWVTLALGIMAGAEAAEWAGFAFEVWTPAICGVATGVIFLLKPFKGKILFIFLFAAFYGLSAVSLDHERYAHSSWRLPGEIIVLSGTVKSFPEKAYYKYKWKFECDQFRMEEGPWHKTKSKVEVSIPATEAAPLAGDHLILKGQIRFPREGEPGVKWIRRNYFLKDIEAQIRVKKWGDVIWDGWNAWFFPLRVLQLIRESMVYRIDKIYPPKHSQIMKALLVGLRMSDYEIRNIFVRSSTSHLLSVSGFHTAVIAGILFSLLILLRASPAMAVLFSAQGILAYMALTGWGVAVQRAGLMAILVWVAWALGRPQTLIHWLNMALACILWIEPKQLWDISFQLSFLSMYGILLIAPPIKRFFPIPGLDVSLAAFWATYPVVLFYFQNFSWAGIFANLIAVPAFALILPLGFFSILPGIGGLAVIPVKFLLGVTLWILEKIAAQSWACLLLPQPQIEWIFAYYIIGGLTLWLGPRPNASHSTAVY